MRLFCPAKIVANQQKIRFSALKLDEKDVWCLDTISIFFLLTSVIGPVLGGRLHFQVAPATASKKGKIYCSTDEVHPL